MKGKEGFAKLARPLTELLQTKVDEEMQETSEGVYKTKEPPKVLSLMNCMLMSADKS